MCPFPPRPSGHYNIKYHTQVYYSRCSAHTHTHRERWTLGFIFPPFFHPLLSTLGVVVTYDLPSQLSSHRSSLIYADCFYDGKEGVIFLDFKSSREEGKKTRRTTQREIPLSLSLRPSSKELSVFGWKSAFATTCLVLLVSLHSITVVQVLLLALCVCARVFSFLLFFEINDCGTISRGKENALALKIPNGERH